MNEHEFLKTLEQRAWEQKKIIKGMLLPKLFIAVSFWLGEHPWRFLIPLSFVLTLALHAVLGKSYIDFILNIFGKL